MHREALEMYYNVLGREHPRIAVALDDLAVVLHQQGDSEQADSLERLSLTMREELLGPDHPDVATSLHHLAQIRQGIGDEQGAERHYQRALEIYRLRFGAGDRHVRAIYKELVDVYESRGMPDRAAPYRRLMAD
jgi:tetratricopeptide (TPR) repeat protein